MNREHNKSTASMLLQSMISIIICCVCLIDSTFAWFTLNTTAKIESVNSAELKFDITVSEKENGAQINIESDVLHAGKTYVINLSLKDTSTAQKGYCLIELGDGSAISTYYTPVFEKGVLESTTIELNVEKTSTMTIIPTWGTHNNGICEDSIVD